MPRLLLLSGKNSLINCLYRLGSNHCDIMSTRLGIQKRSSKQQAPRQPTCALFER